MKITKGLNPVLRAAGVISAVAIVTGGVTFAALSSSVTLSDTTLSTANADLQIYNFSGETPGFDTTAPGFNLDNLIPGEYSEAQKFYLKNNGSTALEVSARILSEGLATPNLGNESNLSLKFTAEDCAEIKEATLGELLAGEVELPCNTLAIGATGNSGVPGTDGNYGVAFKIAEGIDTDITGLDLRFTGTVATSNETQPVDLN